MFLSYFLIQINDVYLTKKGCLRMHLLLSWNPKKVKESRLSKFFRSINLLYLTLLSQNTKLTRLYNYWRGNNWKSFARKSRNDRLGKASPSARALISALDSVMFWRRLPYLKILNNFALPIFFFFLLSFYVIPEIKKVKIFILIHLFSCLFVYQCTNQRLICEMEICGLISTFS